jgi:hypothetical protein
VESPSVQPEGELPNSDAGPTPDAIDLNALRERMRSGEHVPPPKPSLAHGETPAAQPPAEHDPSAGEPTLEEIRQALREGRATGPQPTGEEIRQAVEGRPRPENAATEESPESDNLKFK